MNNTDALVANYLEGLENELSDLPRARRDELVQEISEHIDEARSGIDVQSEAEMRNTLDRLGDPAEIAAEARERFGVPPQEAPDEGYDLRRRVVYFVIGVPLVFAILFGVFWLVASAVDVVTGWF